MTLGFVSSLALPHLKVEVGAWGQDGIRRKKDES